MATEVKIVTLHQGVNKDSQQPIAPRTKTNAVSDENGIGLNALLTDMNNKISNKADKSSLGTQCTFSLSGTTLTITTK